MGISIRKFLLLNLLLVMTIIISLTAIGNYYLGKQDIEKYLDSSLSQAGLSFTAIASRDIQHQNWEKLQARLNAVPVEGQQYVNNGRENEGRVGKYRFQIWNDQHQLLVRSENAPSIMLSKGKPGFNDIVLDHVRYRVFSNFDPESKLTFVVAEPYHERDQLAHHMMVDDLYILFLIYPLAGLLIWVVIGRGLGSLSRITEALRHRQPRYLEPVSLANVPIEVRPLIEELNKLLNRLHDALEREKRFASDAAHELRTPLAAIRTQAQLAMMIATSPEQQVILQNVILGVDRSTHIVSQLLSMSRLIPENEQMQGAEVCELDLIVKDVIMQLKPVAETKKIEIIFNKLSAKAPEFLGNPAAMHILVRNLIDNAIRYTPIDSKVNVTIEIIKKNIILKVADNGPGVPAEFRGRIFERFFRMLGTESPGSGLGLSIVRQIADLHQATIAVSATDPATGTGLTVQIKLPLLAGKR